MLILAEGHPETMISLGFQISISMQHSYLMSGISYTIVNSEKVEVLGQEIMAMVCLRPNGSHQETNVLEDILKDPLIQTLAEEELIMVVL